MTELDEQTNALLAAYTVKYQRWLKNEVTQDMLATAGESGRIYDQTFRMDIEANKPSHFYAEVYERIADGYLCRAVLERGKRRIREKARAETISGKLHSEATAGADRRDDDARESSGLPGLPADHPANRREGKQVDGKNPRRRKRSD